MLVRGTSESDSRVNCALTLWESVVRTATAANFRRGDAYTYHDRRALAVVSRSVAMLKNPALFVALALATCFATEGVAQRARVLRDVKTIQVDDTVIANPNKVKEDFAANLVQDSLRNALRSANFEVGAARVRAHIVLDEFSSGNTAKRMLVGFGAGRSTVDGRLVFRDATGTEMASVKIRVRGNLLWSGYQGGNTQRRQATNAFDQRLMEEIARLK
jgi:hypothetical protein